MTLHTTVPYVRDQVAKSADDQGLLRSVRAASTRFCECGIPRTLADDANVLVKQPFPVQFSQFEGRESRLSLSLPRVLPRIEEGEVPYGRDDEISQWTTPDVGHSDLQALCLGSVAARRQFCTGLLYRRKKRVGNFCRHRARIQRGSDVLRQVREALDFVGDTSLPAAAEQE